MKFIETITWLGNDVLVPINQIQFVWRKMGDNGFEIHIKGSGESEWVECFGSNEKKYDKRWEDIKATISAA